VAFVCGLALGSSAINVYVRDTRYVLESFTTVLFWLVPIFYSFADIPQKYSRIYEFNPVAALIFAMRNILMDGTAPPMSIIVNLTLAASFTLALGFLIFGRLKLRFYEHI
jgi:ABC-type polysaccharide/polyol phosphate export permease